MHAIRARVAFLPLVALLTLTVTLSLPAARAHVATPEATPTDEASREVLHTGFPVVVPGYELSMTRVVIPAGVTVAAHSHPGMQLIHIESGSVHYTVVSGELPYTRAGEDGATGVEGVLVAGEEMEFGPGDSFTELPGMVHIAENRTDVPVVILSSSLFPTSVPASIPTEPE